MIANKGLERKELLMTIVMDGHEEASLSQLFNDSVSKRHLYDVIGNYLIRNYVKNELIEREVMG